MPMCTRQVVRIIFWQHLWWPPEPRSNNPFNFRSCELSCGNTPASYQETCKQHFKINIVLLTFRSCALGIWSFSKNPRVSLAREDVSYKERLRSESITCMKHLQTCATFAKQMHFRAIPSRPKLLQKILFKKNCFGTINFVKSTKQSLYKAKSFVFSCK